MAATEGNARRRVLILAAGAVLLFVYLGLALLLAPGSAATQSTRVARLSSLTPESERPTQTPMPTQAESLSPTSTATSVPPYVAVPTPLSFLPAEFGAGGGATPECKSRLVVVVYSDDNRDETPSPGEAVTGVQVVLNDSSFTRLGAVYTSQGRAVFCLPGSGEYYVDLPYFQITRVYRSLASLSGSSQDTLEIRIDPPDLPVRLP